jgi:hypothetical protein
MNRTANGLHHGFAQYRYPRSFQLAGAGYAATTADGHRTTLEVLDHERLTIAVDDGPTTLSYYEAFHVATDVHLVSLAVADRVLVLDTARGHLVDVDLAVGTQRVSALDGVRSPDDVDVVATDEMVGTDVRWTVGDGASFTQEYCSGSTDRISFAPRDDRVKDCAAVHLRLADGLYLVVVHAFVPPGVCLPQALGELVMVQDFEHMVLTGVALSSVFNERLVFSGYGAFRDDD